MAKNESPEVEADAGDAPLLDLNDAGWHARMRAVEFSVGRDSTRKSHELM